MCVCVCVCVCIYKKNTKIQGTTLKITVQNHTSIITFQSFAQKQH